MANYTIELFLPGQSARNTQARYNVCPTDPVDTIVDHDGKRELVSMRWGLVPRWWSKTIKDVKMATFNGGLKRSRPSPFSETPLSARAV